MTPALCTTVEIAILLGDGGRRLFGGKGVGQIDLDGIERGVRPVGPPARQ